MYLFVCVCVCLLTCTGYAVCLPCTAMAPRAGCLLLPLLLIASARVISIDAECGVIPPEEDACTVDETIYCKDCSAGDQVPNPFDCSSYYMCESDGVFLFDKPFPCPDGDIFDETLKRCMPDGKCTPACDQPGGGGSCFYTCDGNSGGKIADPFDCSVYHECDITNPGPATACPADAPYFDGEKCGVDESACCHCRPYCYIGEILGTYVEDPTDCRKYFVCEAEHKIPTIQTECEDGEHFDSHAKQCSSTAPCMTLCRNVVDENGCIDPYTCQELGYFPKCKTQCLSEYYHCVEVSDDYATPESCPNDLVFNPDTLTCIKSETCPYTHK